MKYQLIIFDLDGTLLDSLAHIVRCVQETATQLGLEVPNDRYIRRGVGLTVADQVNRVFPDLSMHLKEQILEKFQDCYFASAKQYTLFSDVVDVLNKLKSQGLFLGIATDMSRAGLDNVLIHTPLGELVDVSRCADDCKSKPNPEMVQEIMDFCAVAADQTLMVGDTEYDIQTARNAGIDVIAVNYGAHSEERLAALEPLKIIDSLAALFREA